MALTFNAESWQKRLATLPLATYGPGEIVFAEGTRTGQLFILRSGLISIVKGDTEIATVSEPGVVFGELSTLLDQPHTADVRTLETSQFYVAEGYHQNYYNENSRQPYCMFVISPKIAKLEKKFAEKLRA